MPTGLSVVRRPAADFGWMQMAAFLIGDDNRIAQHDGETASSCGSANRHTTNPTRSRGDLGQNANFG